MILDIHTHHLYPQPYGVINLRLIDGDLAVVRNSILSGQLYSIGIHPWDVDNHDESAEFWKDLEKIISLNNVVAIGEAGIDPNGNAPIFEQMLVLKKQIELSEKIGKPLIIHTVKSDDVICGLRRDLNPRMPWLIHGYRGKPQGAAQLIKRGCMIGFGEKFNSETLRSVPLDKILAETDESRMSIDEVIKGLSEVRGGDLKPVIAENSSKFLNFEKLCVNR